MDFQSKNSFGKLRRRAFQPYHQLLCMLKHVEEVEGQNNLQHHQHTSVNIDLMVWLESPMSQLSKTFFD